ncbi:MAG: hypothetical protein LLG01_13765 [Planctomycetaceae bacterium]|nr:hypothetical protein [Planctomycetaceae bacterium]
MNIRSRILILAAALVGAWCLSATILADQPPIPPGQVDQSNASPTPIEPAPAPAAAAATEATDRCDTLLRQLRQVLDQARAAADAQDARAASGHIARAQRLLTDRTRQVEQSRQALRQAEAPPEQ